ncbi:hypothetical protein Agub_g7512 [Astrephomene gubernaculifera]|uniref:non-specific serine/threonine protein kinase n=1 Tax=Astrephomene gubernaculifera TaxID=47775 RepID=A0AAD3DSW1_9CHLO|nr:hypothetical protein Agub_g7512 [Astrephomene gubernaculifera]
MSSEDYTAVRQIGKGAFGTAHIVEHKVTGERFVLKRVRLARQSAKERQCSVRELLLLSNLRHRNVLEYKGCWIEGGCNLCLLVELCESGDLFTQLRLRHPGNMHFSEEHLQEMAVQLLSALAYLHRCRIAHRDLKTANVLITGEGCLKLADFGLSVVLEPSIDGGLTRTVVGTPNYMSPCVLQEKPYGFPNDIWGLGCVLFELSALKPAFQAFNMAGLIRKVTSSPPPSLPTMYSERWRNLIRCMLCKDPQLRPTAEELLQLDWLQPAVRRVAARFGTELPPGAAYQLDQLADLPADIMGLLDTFERQERDEKRRAEEARERRKAEVAKWDPLARAAAAAQQAALAAGRQPKLPPLKPHVPRQPLPRQPVLRGAAAAAAAAAIGGGSNGMTAGAAAAAARGHRTAAGGAVGGKAVGAAAGAAAAAAVGGGVGGRPPRPPGGVVAALTSAPKAKTHRPSSAPASSIAARRNKRDPAWDASNDKNRCSANRHIRSNQRQPDPDDDLRDNDNQPNRRRRRCHGGDDDDSEGGSIDDGGCEETLHGLDGTGGGGRVPAHVVASSLSRPMIAGDGIAASKSADLDGRSGSKGGCGARVASQHPQAPPHHLQPLTGDSEEDEPFRYLQPVHNLSRGNSQGSGSHCDGDVGGGGCGSSDCDSDNLGVVHSCPAATFPHRVSSDISSPPQAGPVAATTAVKGCNDDQGHVHSVPRTSTTVTATSTATTATATATAASATTKRAAVTSAKTTAASVAAATVAAAASKVAKVVKSVTGAAASTTATAAAATAPEAGPVGRVSRTNSQSSASGGVASARSAAGTAATTRASARSGNHGAAAAGGTAAASASVGFGIGARRFSGADPLGNGGSGSEAGGSVQKASAAAVRVAKRTTSTGSGAAAAAPAGCAQPTGQPKGGSGTAACAAQAAEGGGGGAAAAGRRPTSARPPLSSKAVARV